MIEDDVITRAARDTVANGYQHIGIAEGCGDERGVGNSDMAHEELFVTTRLRRTSRPTTKRRRKDTGPLGPSVETERSPIVGKVAEVPHGLVEEICDVVVEQHVVDVPSLTIAADHAEIPEKP